MLPIQGLSGIEQVLQSDISVPNVATLALRASTLQARMRSRDLLLAETQLEGRRPFTVIAVFSSKLGLAARFLHARLVTIVKKTLQASSAGSRVSPLYSAFVKLHSSYKKQTPLHDSIFTHVECSVILLDLLRGRVFSLSYGDGTHPPHITSSYGHAAFPNNSREHILDGVVVEDAVYNKLIGDHHVVLGSPGLWQHVHPSKVALHAAAYAAAPQLTNAAHQHDAASAIVRCALRKVAARCEASPSARLACLNTLSQLDRLRPGSRSEARGTQGLVPRMRGDIHADMTASTLSFTFHEAAHPAASAEDHRAQHIQDCPMCKYAAAHLIHTTSRAAAAPAAVDLASAASTPSFRCSATCSLREPSSIPPTPREPQTPRRSCSGRNIVARTLCRLSNRRCPFSRAACKSTSSGSPRDSTDTASLYATSAPSSLSLASPLMHASHATRNSADEKAPEEAARRWELLRRHVRLMALEAGLRQSMWHAAVSVARSAQHAAARTESCSTCASCCSESSDVCSPADPVVWISEAGTDANQAGWVGDEPCMGGQVCGPVAAC